MLTFMFNKSFYQLKQIITNLNKISLTSIFKLPKMIRTDVMGLKRTKSLFGAPGRRIA